ncbi:hypothetical protein GXP67_36455 [Rhodocytophaga rosea]|uniref:Uncharacterized protein n=1 Tax=Rhodocytophaga rosea TaxID=2704465 RepID=A0A6C0GU88_9BACT|nr:hypothetical protein [Rhodocytophaga rosea]QHT71768.1 hypothetical protein GXP67_36455 [Rhodocytophaga rosea]
MNTFLRRQTNRRIAELIYQQLSTCSSVDFKHYKPLDFQFWPKKAT